MFPPDPMPLTEPTDAELVAACLEGEREAFAGIVRRYQTLLCSLAYSATGDVGESEDVAQETFVVAWRELRALDDTAKLRAWLCGILRFRLSHRRRSNRREPVHGAGRIDELHELASAEPAADRQAIDQEEQAIVWRALAAVPETYREPLILYYREHRSLEHVAAALGLTEDAAKQRLSRGRKILQEQALALVEGALARSAPGQMFTIGVLAALPAAATGKAAGLGSLAMKGGLLAKWAGAAAAVTATASAVSNYFGLRARFDAARTTAERRMVTRSFLVCAGMLFAMIGTLLGLRAVALRWSGGATMLAVAAQALVVGFAVWLPVWLFRLMRDGRSLRRRERELHPENFRGESAAAGEYRSRWRLGGIPLVHVRFAWPDEGAPPVVGWIAVGDRAYGVLFALGGFAVGPIAVGTFSVGLLSIGVVGVGAVSISDVGIGWIATGNVAIGWRAVAWLSALGWDAVASDGFAIAWRCARGAVAVAAHANDEVARLAFANPHARRDTLIWFALLIGFTVVPIVWYARAVRARLGRNRGAGIDRGRDEGGRDQGSR